MIPVTVNAYKCSICGGVFLRPHDHDPDQCVASREHDRQAREAYQRRLEDATEQAVAVAKNHQALRSLVAHGYKLAAFSLAQTIYDDEGLPDIDSSLGMTAIYTAMLAAAEKAGAP